MQDGIGDACQCGDAAGGGSVFGSDALAIGAFLTGSPILVPSRCNVRGPSDGGATDCDLVDLAVIRRALAFQAPGIQQVCAPALP
jgi:hypothetical protein